MIIRALVGALRGPLMEGEPAITLTLQSLLTSVSTTLSSLIGWMIDIFNVALQSPVVLVFIVMALIGTAVAFTRKLLNN